MIEQPLTKLLSVIFIVVTIYPTATVPSVLPMISVMKRDADKQAVIPECKEEPQIYHMPYIVEKKGFDLNSEEMEKFKIWDKGTIPFYIDVPSFSDKALRDRIRWYLNEVNSLTPLNFIELPRPPVDYQEDRWVYFLNRGSYLGCHDISIDNFTTKGVQRVVLGYDCLTRGGGLAEIVLALAGVPPQHNAPNRDEYISVLEENIVPEKKYLFKKLDNRDWLFHDIEYDPESAGHYNEHKHSINGLATIKWKGYCTDVTPLGQDEGFSKNDIKKINMLYFYIVTKNKTNLPTCRKIFARVENSTTKSFYEGRRPLPERKPNKYLGIQSDEKNEKDDDSTEKAKGGQQLIYNSDKNINDSNERDDNVNDNNEKDNNEKDNNENDNNENDNNEIYDNENDNNENDNNENDNNENDNNENGESKTTNSNESSQNSVNQSNSEKNTSDKVNGRNLMALKTTRKPLNSYKDPLTYLSDYGTGDEYPRRKKVSVKWQI